MPDIDAAYISDKHEFASGLFDKANENALEVERVFKGEYQTDEDQAESSNPASPRSVRTRSAFRRRASPRSPAILRP